MQTKGPSTVTVVLTPTASTAQTVAVADRARTDSNVATAQFNDRSQTYTQRSQDFPYKSFPVTETTSPGPTAFVLHLRQGVDASKVASSYAALAGVQSATVTP